MMRRPRSQVLAALMLAGFATAPALAQQTTITPAATQPGKGVVVQRTLAQATWWDADVAETGFADAFELRTDVSFAYGLSGSTSLLATIPVVHRDFDGPGSIDTSDPTGLGDPTIEFRHRFVNDALGPVDTRRIAWFAGVELPLGRDAFSSDSVDPYVGIALTQITGRLGVGAALSWNATTGASSRPLHPGDTTADLLRLTGSLAWRVSPVEWSADLEAAFYVTLESEVTYETNGNAMLRLAPGLLYEAPNLALELAVLVPIAEDTSRDAEHELAVTAGVRVFF